jgi:5S rRNA maturation endonuclease (ribonuclease M5)
LVHVNGPGAAAAKRITADFLKACGVSEFTYDHKPALRIPYLGPDGEELAVRFRIALDGDRFHWKSSTKPCLYGLHRLTEARKAGQVVMVEGESDCHTLWLHGIPAVGIPGANNWREERDAPHLDGIETIYVVVEPDRGGDVVQKWLSRSTIRHRAKVVSLPTKDPSALHLQGPEEFVRRWQVACLGAIP